MICKCGCTNLYCLNSREIRENVRKRIYCCYDCGRRYKTLEVLDNTKAFKIKKLPEYKLKSIIGEI